VASNTILGHSCVVWEFVEELIGGGSQVERVSWVVAVQNGEKRRMTKSVPCITKLVLIMALIRVLS
jgi:hypothetical protein